MDEVELVLHEANRTLNVYLLVCGNLRHDPLQNYSQNHDQKHSQEHDGLHLDAFCSTFASHNLSDDRTLDAHILN